MCQWAMRSRFDRSENRQIRKVASLSAQALSYTFPCKFSYHIGGEAKTHSPSHCPLTISDDTCSPVTVNFREAPTKKASGVCLHPRNRRIFRGSVDGREPATRFSRPCPTLPFANGSMPARSPVILPVANLYSLFQHLAPGKPGNIGGGAGEHTRAAPSVRMNVAEMHIDLSVWRSDKPMSCLE